MCRARLSAPVGAFGGEWSRGHCRQCRNNRRSTIAAAPKLDRRERAPLERALPLPAWLSPPCSPCVLWLLPSGVTDGFTQTPDPRTPSPTGAQQVGILRPLHCSTDKLPANVLFDAEVPANDANGPRALACPPGVVPAECAGEDPYREPLLRAPRTTGMLSRPGGSRWEPFAAFTLIALGRNSFQSSRSACSTTSGRAGWM